MTEFTETIASAGNVEVPAYLALQSVGCAVTREIKDGGNEWWIAIRGQCRYVASSPIELLGLIATHDECGPIWKAEDREIDEFLGMYYPDALSN